MIIYDELKKDIAETLHGLFYNTVPESALRECIHLRIYHRTEI
jgi:hypothetical protein